MGAAAWKGTQLEQSELLQAVAANCQCVEADGVTRQPCAPHRMLTDQRMLDDLLFARRLAECLKREEGLDAI